MSEKKHEVHYFTFGTNHVTKGGDSLGRYYAVIGGDYAEARKKIMELRGPKWSMQYNEKEFEGMKEKYKLKLAPLDFIELPREMQKVFS